MCVNLHPAAMIYCDAGSQTERSYSRAQRITLVEVSPPRSKKRARPVSVWPTRRHDSSTRHRQCRCDNILASSLERCTPCPGSEAAATTAAAAGARRACQAPVPLAAGEDPDCHRAGTQCSSSSHQHHKEEDTRSTPASRRRDTLREGTRRRRREEEEAAEACLDRCLRLHDMAASLRWSARPLTRMFCTM